MKRYRLIYRGLRDTYYAVDTHTNKRETLRTSNAQEAQRLIGLKNEAVQNAEMNLQIAQVYLHHSDSLLSSRTWENVMHEMAATRTGPTRERYEMAIKDAAFDSIRHRTLLKTTAQQFLTVLRTGTVSTNVYLRRFHNFAMGMHWLPWPILPRLQWPSVQHKEKRAVTLGEHHKILAREFNPEMNAYLRLLWHTGGAQTDVACLAADAIDWNDRTIAFSRKKTGVPVVITFGPEAAAILENLPKNGPLFPRLAQLHEKHRAKLFTKRLATVGITGISLHSYRYAWAERAKCAGMPERYAQQALGHSSKALARAYSRKAKVTVPSLEDYEASVASKVVALPTAVNQ